MIMPNGAAACAGLEIGARAQVSAPASACATGAEAIACGLDLIRSRRADVVVAGGADAAIHPVILAGFAAMGAMSRRNAEPAAASRPFDIARDGFVMGEGAAVLIMERAADGRGMARALRKALDDARLLPGQVVHVNAHATSTPLGDRAECLPSGTSGSGKLPPLFPGSRFRAG